jgi:ATP-binding protein involved in chromosome partitioning
MPLSESSIVAQLKTVKYPGFTRDIVSFGLIKEIKIDGGKVSVHLGVTSADSKVPNQIKESSLAALKSVEGVTAVDVHVDVTAPVAAAMQAGQGQLPQNKIPGIQHVVAIASGKGGVGKSTVAANLSISLQKLGYRVGLCDCDLYGPSIALMFGSAAQPYATEDEKIEPITQYGIKLMSMGFLLGDASPAILRGPMVTRYTQQFLRSVAWGELDFLILDLPPGTGDIQLTIVQTVALSGAVVVTTPQEVALIDARKAVTMFEKVNVKVLGIIENMSYFLCPNDKNRYDIFGSGGGRREAERLNVPLLAEIPLEIGIRETGDQGMPIAAAAPDSAVSNVFLAAAKQVYSSVKKNEGHTP